MDRPALLGAAITAALGLMGLLRPSSAAALTSIAPIGRGAEPQVRTTVARVERCPASSQAMALLMTSVSTLSIMGAVNVIAQMRDTIKGSAGPVTGQAHRSSAIVAIAAGVCSRP